MKRKKRTTYHHNDLPEALLTAAEELIATHGVSGFSLREAARVVGVDPAACYRHFRNKEDVVHALARRGFTRLQVSARESLVEDPKESILRIGHAYVSFALENGPLFRIMFGDTGVDARRSDVLRGDYNAGSGAYDMLVESLTKIPVSRPEEAAIALWAAAHGLAHLLLDGALRPASTAERDATIDRVLLSCMAGQQ